MPTPLLPPHAVRRNRLLTATRTHTVTSDGREGPLRETEIARPTTHPLSSCERLPTRSRAVARPPLLLGPIQRLGIKVPPRRGPRSTGGITLPQPPQPDPARARVPPGRDPFARSGPAALRGRSAGVGSRGAEAGAARTHTQTPNQLPVSRALRVNRAR